MDEHEARLRQTVALVSIAESLQILAANAPDIRAALVRIAASQSQIANDDPLSRVERALDRAGEVLGYETETLTLDDGTTRTFDNRFAGQPIEERMR